MITTREEAMSEERMLLLRDAEHHATELIARLEALLKTEEHRHLCSDWAQAAKLTRRIRGLARIRLEADRRRARLVRR